ncbi:PREDICTED: aluminum-activated malate transporter 14-like [Ipomoea nil]|uniref:aluminum-activated malate transporter 14-like n=1 Tax=Ipomoea nil TaxID=35883 RepID=UPI000900D0FA|nr:PREDICTED: aluminum-activated malate transporter 14-like [Ipomoea nil]
MNSVVVVVPINNPEGDDKSRVAGGSMEKTTEERDHRCCFVSKNGFSSIKEKMAAAVKSEFDKRKAVHSVKVGMALVLVSLLYMLDPLFRQVGQNAMWAIMTVVVVFEFFAGATLSKGINRGIGTIVGGLLGCFAAVLADQLPGYRSAFVVGISIFIISAAATYSRLVPGIKRKYDYGVMIFILTFNLVVVSGVRAYKVMKLARERLCTIGMGFAVCIFISLLVFPEWAGDELHSSTAAKFDKIASSLQGCLEEYFMVSDEKESKATADVSGCKAVLHSKSNEESLANFAKWEPWHGRFGFAYPWEKYLEIGEALRELAATVISLKGCIQSSAQPLPTERGVIKEACEAVGVTLVWSLREIGESIKDMKVCRAKVTISPKLQSMKQDNLNNHNNVNSPSDLGMATFVFLLNEMVEKVQVLATKVEQLGDIAGFHTKKFEA